MSLVEERPAGYAENWRTRRQSVVKGLRPERRFEDNPIISRSAQRRIERERNIAATEARHKAEQERKFEERIAALKAGAERREDWIASRTTVVGFIQSEACRRYRVSRPDLLSKKKRGNPALTRQITYYLAHKVTLLSLPRLGELFGGRDHTTILYAIRKIGSARLKDSALDVDLREFEAAVLARFPRKEIAGP